MKCSTHILLLTATFCMVIYKSNARLHAPVSTDSKLSAPSSQSESSTDQSQVATDPVCVCGVYLSGQVVRGSNKPPEGNPALIHEMDERLSCSSSGIKQCTNKCLDVVIKHLPNSPSLICGSIDRDCHKERAYLFVKNCSGTWVNTNLSAGREYCCKDNVSYKCPSSKVK